MKKLALTLAGVAALALPSMASAQITGEIEASATIATVLDWGTATPMSFGSVIPGATKTARGSIPITRNVGVTFTLPQGGTTGLLTRSGTGTQPTLQPTFTCGVAANNTAAAADWVTTFSACNVASPTSAALAAPAQTTTEHLIFDGTLVTAASTQPGTYTGSIRITATAN